MKFFDHKGLGNHLLQLCPKVVKHPVCFFFIIMYYEVRFVVRNGSAVRTCWFHSMVTLPSWPYSTFWYMITPVFYCYYYYYWEHPVIVRISFLSSFFNHLQHKYLNNLNYLKCHNFTVWRCHLEALLLLNIYTSSKSCPALLETVGLLVSNRNLRDSAMLNVVFKRRNCPSARCAVSANVISMDSLVLYWMAGLFWLTIC